MVLNTYHMADEEIPRSIRFPKEVWEALDNDAKRCKRSSVKQLEALLYEYYGLDHVELNKERLAEQARNHGVEGINKIPNDWKTTVEKPPPPKAVFSTHKRFDPTKEVSQDLAEILENGSIKKEESSKE